ncbi:NAD-dependent epimerase/dehydratase family protein [Microbacterium lacticum]
MRIFVTGAMGQVGQRTVKSLKSKGHDVVGFDLVAPPDADPREWVAGDLSDIELLRRSMDGAEVVVHFGAISDPIEWTRYPEIIATNVVGTYNVFETARLLGIKRVVFSSTINTIGLISWLKPWAPDYLPIDENHPTKPDDNYGATKLMGEVLARGFHVRHDMEIVCVRFTGVLFADMPASIQRYQGFLADVDGELVNRMWSYLRSEDAIEGVERALFQPGLGYERIFLAAPDSVTGEERIESLIARHYPTLTEQAERLVAERGSNASIVNTDNAADLLGWKPTLSYLQIPELQRSRSEARR